MSINSFQFSADYHNKCKTVFDLLNCNLLWVMHSNNNELNIIATDQAILEHYLEKKYYLYDPNVNAKSFIDNNQDWLITLGTDSETFNKSGFLYDMYKMFNIEEFVSIEHKVGVERYCYRFFTRNNRFIFMNKLLKHIPLVKHFVTSMTKTIKTDLKISSNINVAS